LDRGQALRRRIKNPPPKLTGRGRKLTKARPVYCIGPAKVQAENMKIHDTNTPKRATLRLNMDALDKIKQRWPVVAEGRPLAISTGEQIAEALGEDVGDAMARHTGTVTYLTACAAPGAQRVNLDGTDAGRVSIANQNWARRQLKALAKIGGTQ
jgi:ProQ/FINO family